jgi:hypothetical protein
VALCATVSHACCGTIHLLLSKSSRHSGMGRSSGRLGSLHAAPARAAAYRSEKRAAWPQIGSTHTPQPCITHAAVTTGFSDRTHASRRPLQLLQLFRSGQWASIRKGHCHFVAFSNQRFLLPTTYGIDAHMAHRPDASSSLLRPSPRH